MQTALGFLSTLVLKGHSKWKATKNEHGEGHNAHPKVRFKSNNNEKKLLTRHEIVDGIAENIASVITQLCKEAKLWIHPNIWRPNFSFTYSLSSLTFVS